MHAAPPSTPPTAEPQAIVAFSGRSELPWLRLLRPGFRHCLLLRRQAAGWLLYDPRSDRTELTLWPSCDRGFLIKALKERGYIVVEASIPPGPRRAAPFGPFTCVEAVKRVLGIRKRWILTPWQLYRWLTQARSRVGLEPRPPQTRHRQAATERRNREIILDK